MYKLIWCILYSISEIDSLCFTLITKFIDQDDGYQRENQLDLAICEHGG